MPNQYTNAIKHWSGFQMESSHFLGAKDPNTLFYMQNQSSNERRHK